MQKIKFLTDTASDIAPEIAKELGIKVLPFPITIGDKGFYEGIDFTPVEFYDILLKEPEIPITSMITTPVFLEEFELANAEGVEHLVVVPINSKGSNTYDAALLALRQFNEEHPEGPGTLRIHILDCLTYTMGYGYPIIQAAKKAAKGESIVLILDYMEKMFRHAHIYFAIYTLAFAKKSGRVRASAAFMGDVLGLRPILYLRNGEIKIIDKVRGDKNTFAKMIAYAKEKRSGNHLEYVIAGGMQEDMTTEFEKACKKELGAHCFGKFHIGSSIAINAGPKVCGIIVYGDE